MEFCTLQNNTFYSTMVYEKSVAKLLAVYGDDPVHVTPTVITDIYEKIFGCLPEGSIKNPVCQSHDESNIARILQTLQDDVLKVDLSHIDGGKVAHGDPMSGKHAFRKRCIILIFGN